MRLPPTWLRRLILAPLVVVAAVALLSVTPISLLIALALTSLVPGRFRLPRVLWLVTVYLVWDAVLVVVLFLLWIASGFGWKLRTPTFVDLHYRVGALALRVLLMIFSRVLRLEMVAAGAADPATDPEVRLANSDSNVVSARAAFVELFSSGSPLIVASRHGGPGDSFILIHTLFNGVHRRPRIVLKDTLQWDPAIDILLNRVPTRFITPTGFGGKRGGGAGVEQRIGELAQGLGPDDALVIFPEGGQVSATRRRHRIDKLRRAGRLELAARAEELRHVMPPQPGGVHAALQATPDSDMILIGHTGLDQLLTLGDIWRELPMDKRIIMRAWRVPHHQIPTDREALAAWLFDWFEHIDAWIEAQR